MTRRHHDPDKRSENRKKRIFAALSQRQEDLTLVLDNIHDPHNVSAILRSCDAFGVSNVQLYYTKTEFPKLGEKTSASARKWVDAIRHRTAEGLREALKATHCQLLAATFSKKARPLREWNFLQPTAVILGNEHGGASAELLAMADGELYIPMHGLIQSFNVSVAAAIILAEAARQREDAGWYEQWRFSDEAFQEKYLAWLKK